MPLAARAVMEEGMRRLLAGRAPGVHANLTGNPRGGLMSAQRHGAAGPSAKNHEAARPSASNERVA